MNVQELLSATRESLTSHRVFAEPVEHDGTTVIPVSAIAGGGGGGGGVQEGAEGSGAGFGLGAKPVGAYVIRDGSVRWVPAVNVEHVVTVAGIVAVAALFAAVRIVRLVAGSPASAE